MLKKMMIVCAGLILTTKAANAQIFAPVQQQPIQQQPVQQQYTLSLKRPVRPPLR